MATNDEIKKKFQPILRWVGEFRSAQAQVLAEEGEWVPLDRMCAHCYIETGGTGDPKIQSIGLNTPCQNVGTDCAPNLRAQGLFQIWWPPFRGVNWNKILDPAYNSYIGARVLAVRYKECGRSWRAASMAFFSGSCVDIGVVDNSTGTSQAIYDQRMTELMKELNQIGIGTGKNGDTPKKEPPSDGKGGKSKPDGGTNTKEETPSGETDEGSQASCVTVLGKEICLPTVAGITIPPVGDILAAAVESWFPRVVLFAVGALVLFVGLKAIT